MGEYIISIFIGAVLVVIGAVFVCRLKKEFKSWDKK